MNKILIAETVASCIRVGEALIKGLGLGYDGEHLRPDVLINR